MPAGTWARDWGVASGPLKHHDTGQVTVQDDLEVCQRGLSLGTAKTICSERWNCPEPQIHHLQRVDTEAPLRPAEMPSFTSRQYASEHLSPLSKDDGMMEDIIHHGVGMPTGNAKETASHISSSLTLVPSDGASLLDYFDLPSPPSTPQQATHDSLSYSSLNSLPSPASTPELVSLSRRNSVSSASTTSSPSASPPSSSMPRWPTPSQRSHGTRLPVRARSRSTSSCSSSSGLSSTTLADDVDVDVDMAGVRAGTGAGERQPPYAVRHARRTPYYPPNSSRNIDRARVYMNRGPHYVPNWTPLSSLPRHVQLQIEEKMIKFTAI